MRCIAAIVVGLVTLACGETIEVGPPSAAASASQFRDLIGKPFDARVVRIADGDTIEAIPSGEPRPIRIRFEGIDAPELGEPFSAEAIALVRTLLFEQLVRVHGRELDRYGRLVARVDRAGKDASTELVRAGLACHAYAADTALARAESVARAARAGFWATAATKPGCVTRTAFSAQPASARGVVSTTVRGNVSSGVYHTASCPNFSCRNCTREFANEADAKAAGFRPAGDCVRP